jgi:hypothetical protein
MLVEKHTRLDVRYPERHGATRALIDDETLPSLTHSAAEQRCQRDQTSAKGY